MAANPIYKDIEGAPFHIGANITVTNLVDINTFTTPEEAEEQYIGQEGVLVYYEYECACAQSYPDDPMIAVKLENGEIQEFWKDELTLTSELTAS